MKSWMRALDLDIAYYKFIRMLLDWNENDVYAPVWM